MKIREIIDLLESYADPSLQESYDNAGLITGNAGEECTGVICSLDATEEVIMEAKKKNYNLVVSHHPIVFKGLKRINGSNYVERTIIAAIKNDIAVYAIHTNLDNVQNGVNGRIAAMMGLKNISVLAPKEAVLKKLFTFVPVEKAEQVRAAIFNAGAGMIGNYSECSFNSEGTGTFKPGEESNPFIGEKGRRHNEPELRIEAVFPAYLEKGIVSSMKKAHPYEEVAYDIISLTNNHPGIGSGMIGSLEPAVSAEEFLEMVRHVFKVPFVRHTKPTGRSIKTVAICGGAGSFLISKALRAGADAYVTADIKYHEFFDANDRIMVCDAGHYESEQFTIDLLQEVIARKFPTFAVLKTEVNTNPVRYF
jgi:dinuclear metal center YbgI/SA1388 family protein